MCGAVRYELRSEPFDCGWCHCRTCQLNSGAPAMVFASVPASDFVWSEDADKVKSVASSSFGHREFCGECGTPFLRVGGQLLVSEPPDPNPERWPSEGIARYGLRRERGDDDHVASFTLIRPVPAAVPHRSLRGLSF